MNALAKTTGTGDREWKLLDLLPVLEALQGLRFGSVELFIQDSRLVQIDRREKIRTVKSP